MLVSQKNPDTWGKKKLKNRISAIGNNKEKCLLWITIIINWYSSKKTNEKREEQQKMSSINRKISTKINPAVTVSLVTNQLDHPLFLECHSQENQRHLRSLASGSSKGLCYNKLKRNREKIKTKINKQLNKSRKICMLCKTKGKYKTSTMAISITEINHATWNCRWESIFKPWMRTKVVTQNCSPAPSQSEAVIMGLETQTNPFSWKNLCVA